MTHCPDASCRGLLKPCDGGEELWCTRCGRHLLVDEVTRQVLLMTTPGANLERPPRFAAPPCPFCESDPTYRKRVGEGWHCLACGHAFRLDASGDVLMWATPPFHEESRRAMS